MPGPAAKLAFGDSIGFLVRDLNRAIQRELQSRIAAHGVPPGAWYFLRVLWEEDGLTQRELAQRVGMREPTAVIALRGMEASGWLRRVRSAEDRRKVHLFLTEPGHALREVLMPAAHAVNARAGQGVDTPAFLALLRQVRENFGAADV